MAGYSAGWLEQQRTAAGPTVRGGPFYLDGRSTESIAMAEPQPTFWQRLKELFTVSQPKNESKSQLPAVGEDGLLLEPVEYPESNGNNNETDAAANSAGSERSTNPLVRWGRREQALNRLQEGYDRVSLVVEEIQKHLAQQGERTERICTALETLARSMSDMPNLARQQAQTLEVMSGHVEAGNARMHQIVEAVGEIPKASRAQTETLGGIKRQLEVTGEQNLVTSQTMEKLSTAIAALGEINSMQIESLRQMNSKTDV
ncbi:MAG: hypothetical protein FWC56_05985, partial [Phycisphaerae bacterium]|nr:hypothetical protein [Phycisphaerae bacterium]